MNELEPWAIEALEKGLRVPRAFEGRGHSSEDRPRRDGGRTAFGIGDFDAKPGDQSIRGEFDMTVELRLEVDTSIDDVPHRAGDVVKVKRGTVKIGNQYRQISGPCAVRKDLQCYR